MPLASVLTQVPLSLYVPEEQIIQSLDVGPEQVVHDVEQALQLVPELKLPSGQGVPEDVVA